MKVLTEEPGSEQAQELVTRLFKERTEIIAPALMMVEVGSVLRKKWSRRLLSLEDMNELWRKFITLPISYQENSPLYQKAWEIAEANRLIHLYDAVYLALCDNRILVCRYQIGTFHNANNCKDKAFD